jgi:hypothetical protein
MREGTLAVTATADVLVEALPDGCALLERLDISTPEGFRMQGRILRGFDTTARDWSFVAVTSLGHFEFWDGEKEGEIWRFYKKSTDGTVNRIWWTRDGDTVVETSEVSSDGGETWSVTATIVHTPVP